MKEVSNKNDKDRMRPEENIYLKVKTSKSIFEGNFSTTITLQKLADEIISTKKLPGGNAYEFYRNGKKIEDMTNPLSSFGFSDGEQLTFGARGSGVQV